MTTVGKVGVTAVLVMVFGGLAALWWEARTQQQSLLWQQTASNAERIEELEEGINAMELELGFLKALYIQGCASK